MYLHTSSGVHLTVLVSLASVLHCFELHFAIVQLPQTILHVISLVPVSGSHTQIVTACSPSVGSVGIMCGCDAC